MALRYFPLLTRFPPKTMNLVFYTAQGDTRDNINVAVIFDCN